MVMYVMVLNDGETYTNIEGCHVLAVPDEVKDVDRWVDENSADGWPVKLTHELNDIGPGRIYIPEVP